jgi:Glycosyl transferase family 64 domain
MKQLFIVALFLSGLIMSSVADPFPYPSQNPTPTPPEMKPSKDITIRLFKAHFHCLLREMMAGIFDAKPNKNNEYHRNPLSQPFTLCFCKDVNKDVLQILFSASISCQSLINSHRILCLSVLTSIFSSFRVNTFRRPDLLEIFLEHYKQCENVKQIQVIWSDQDTKAPIAMLERYPKGKVIFEVHDSNSLNNRFHNLINIPTEVSDFIALSYSILLQKNNLAIISSPLLQILSCVILTDSRHLSKSADSRNNAPNNYFTAFPGCTEHR